MLGNVQLAVPVVSSIVLFTILMVIGNTMAMSVRERRREVGILKTLGFRPRQILGLPVGEALANSSLPTWRAAQVMQDSCPQQGTLAKPCAGERVETRGRER